MTNKIPENPIVAFTGHRPSKLLGQYDLNSEANIFLKNRIKLALKRLKPSIGISGMALGVDTLAAMACIDLKIPLICALPCKDQEKIWPKVSQNLYHRILKKAFKVEFISQEPYTHSCMQRRNEWMVDSCDVLLAVWDGSEGGTKNCILYAKATDRPIEYLKLEKVK